MIHDMFFEADDDGQAVRDAICTLMGRNLTARQKQVHLLTRQHGLTHAEAALELSITPKEVRSELRVIMTCLSGLEAYLAAPTPPAAKNRADRVVRKTLTDPKGTFMPCEAVWAASDDVALGDALAGEDWEHSQIYCAGDQMDQFLQQVIACSE